MVDWEGNIVEERHRERVIVEDLPDDMEMSAAAVIGAAESQVIDANFERIDDASWPLDSDPIHSQEQESLSNTLSATRADSELMILIGATTR